MGTPSNYALRLPASLKQGAEQVAREDGTTLNQFIVSAVAEKLSGEAVEPWPMTPEQFGQYIKADVARWTALAKARNIRLDE